MHQGWMYLPYTQRRMSYKLSYSWSVYYNVHKTLSPLILLYIEKERTKFTDLCEILSQASNAKNSNTLSNVCCATFTLYFFNKEQFNVGQRWTPHFNGLVHSRNRALNLQDLFLFLLFIPCTAFACDSYRDFPEVCTATSPL